MSCVVAEVFHTYVYDVVPMIRLKYKNLFLMPALEDDRTGLVFGYQYEFNFK